MPLTHLCSVTLPSHLVSGYLLREIRIVVAQLAVKIREDVNCKMSNTLAEIQTVLGNHSDRGYCCCRGSDNLVTFVQEPKDLVFLLLHIRNYYCPLFYFSSLTIPCCVK